MKSTTRTLILPAVFLSFILMSCASTSLLSTWKDESYSGDVKNVLIIAVVEKLGVRRVLERQYVFLLKGYGVDAVPSHEILPADKMMDKNAILSMIGGIGIDSVLISSLVSKDKLITDLGYSAYDGWYGHYSYNYGHISIDDIFNLENSLYDVKREKLIWSTLSETFIVEGGSTFKEIRPFIEVILKNLSRDKLI